MNWTSYANRLASEVTHPVSRWLPAVAAVPRHLFVPRWWACSAPGEGLAADAWELRDGPADPGEWLRVAYSDRTLVTQVGWLHADYARHDDRPSGLATSVATLPRLVVQMLRHAAPVVHQSGPRRLWDILDDVRHAWLRDGSLPVCGAEVTITPEGTIHLKRGRWQATIASALDVSGR